MSEERTVSVELPESAWDSTVGAWRHAILEVPGVEVSQLFVEGNEIGPKSYQYSQGLGALRLPNVSECPGVGTVVVRFPAGKLAAKSDVDRWKMLSVVLPFLAAIISSGVTLGLGLRGPGAGVAVSGHAGVVRLWSGMQQEEEAVTLAVDDDALDDYKDQKVLMCALVSDSHNLWDTPFAGRVREVAVSALRLRRDITLEYDTRPSVGQTVGAVAFFVKANTLSSSVNGLLVSELASRYPFAALWNSYQPTFWVYVAGGLQQAWAAADASGVSSAAFAQRVSNTMADLPSGVTREVGRQLYGDPPPLPLERGKWIKFGQDIRRGSTVSDRVVIDNKLTVILKGDRTSNPPESMSMTFGFEGKGAVPEDITLRNRGEERSDLFEYDGTRYEIIATGYSTNEKRIYIRRLVR